jgi:hypothetical protein
VRLEALLRGRLDRPLSAGVGRRLTVALLGACLGAALLVAPAAQAGQHWILSGATSVPNNYWQGLTSDPAQENVFFVGVFKGLWGTNPLLGETSGVSSEIPASVTEAEGYDHIGDPTWNDADGGRVLLPLECYTPGVGNTCGTGAFGVADPDTLAFRYYVKLDPADIPKAMWAETSPDGSLVWTSSGDDLLAYRTADITAANAGPDGPLLKPVERLEGAVPPSGITGAVFQGGRLLLAGEGDDSHQIWSVDTDTGAGELLLQRQICGEAEGLDTIATLGGKLHWLISPADPGCDLSFGPTSALLHFAKSGAHRRYDVEVVDSESGAIPGPVSAKVRVGRRSDGKPLRGGKVALAGVTARTNGGGVATLKTRLERAGRYKAVVRKNDRWGASGLIQLGEPEAAKRPIPRGGAA